MYKHKQKKNININDNKKENYKNVCICTWVYIKFINAEIKCDISYLF